MAEKTELQFTGDWRIKISKHWSGSSMRVMVTGTADGTVNVYGAPGTTKEIYGDGETPWTLRIEVFEGGWKKCWLKPSESVIGAKMEWTVGAEDTMTSESDRDFDDLVILVQKLGALSQPLPPFAIRPETMQAMPEGIFEASLGRYFMAVQVKNIWHKPWPDSARVGFTDRSRSWLAKGGVQVVDEWPDSDQAAFGQIVQKGQVLVGALEAGATKRIFFKVDVSGAQPRKHYVELLVDTDEGAEDLSLVSKKAKAPMQVMRTVYDPMKKAFVSECDVGTLTAKVLEMVVDMNTFNIAMGKARRIFKGGAGSPPRPGAPGGHGRCDPRKLDELRQRLRAFLEGRDVDICGIWREIACCCAGAGAPEGPSGVGWTELPDPGISFFVWPTIIEYGIDYKTPFEGQYGPIPFEDPLWKVVAAILLSLAAALSSIADLAYRSDEVVIGTLARSIFDSHTTEPPTNPDKYDPASVDAAVVRLNGNRSLTSAVFSLLDAQNDDSQKSVIIALDGRIDTPGTFLNREELLSILDDLGNHPNDPLAIAPALAYRSSAKSGLGLGILGAFVPISPRNELDGSTSYFINQLWFYGDSGDAPGQEGDSGSLWIQRGTNAVMALLHGVGDEPVAHATATPIEDVLQRLGIRFA